MPSLHGCEAEAIWLSVITTFPKEYGMSEGSSGQCLPSEQFARTVVFGNTASGKSWLSKQLGAKQSSRVVDLDQIRWIDGDYSRRETKQVAVAKTVEKAKRDQWIIEGVYGWLVSPILDRATCLIWTDIPWSESRKNLLTREMALGSSGNFEELETWSADYWNRKSASSYGAHLAIYKDFGGPKYRLLNMKETSGFIDRMEIV
jgi:adenylate kinase family enzyme